MSDKKEHAEGHLVMAVATLKRIECFKNPHYLFHISCRKNPIKMSGEGKPLQKTKQKK